MEFKIRNEEAKEIEQVREILKAAFPTEAESKLVDALRANGKASISLVAERSGQVLGHILFSPVTTTPPSAVPPNVQAQGIGSQLIREGLCLCQELEDGYCFVLGNPKYYQRFGFARASKCDLQNEYGVDDEFMVIRFSNHGMSEKEMAHGLVRYTPEFALFSV